MCVCVCTSEEKKIYSKLYIAAGDHEMTGITFCNACQALLGLIKMTAHIILLFK